MIEERLALVHSAIDNKNYREAFEQCRLLLAELKVANREINPQNINYVGIADEAIRRVVDPPYTNLARTLDVAYYQFWRQGQSAPWHGYDVIPGDPVATKAQFDKLGGLIWHEYAIALDEADQLLDPEDRIPAHRKLATEDGVTKRQAAEQWMTRESITLPVAARPPRVTRTELYANRTLIGTGREG